MWPPACSPPGNVPPPSRRGGACPSRQFPESLWSTLGFRHAGRRAGSSRPTGGMVHGGRAGQETRPYGAILALRVIAPYGRHGLCKTGGGYANSPNRDHLLAPVIFTSRNCPRASRSPVTRTSRLPGVRAVRSYRGSSLTPSKRQRTVFPI